MSFLTQLGFSCADVPAIDRNLIADLAISEVHGIIGSALSGNDFEIREINNRGEIIDYLSQLIDEYNNKVRAHVSALSDKFKKVNNGVDWDCRAPIIIVDAIDGDALYHYIMSCLEDDDLFECIVIDTREGRMYCNTVTQHVMDRCDIKF